MCEFHYAVEPVAKSSHPVAYVTESPVYNPRVAKRASRRDPHPAPPPSPASRLPRRWLTPAAAWLAFVFLLKLGVLLGLASHPLLQAKGELDSAYYLELARQVAGGDLLAGDRVFFLSPFYIYFMAIPLALSGGSVTAVLLSQILLGTATVWLLGDLAGRFLGERARWAALVLGGLSGYITFNEVLLLQSAVDPFLTALGLWLLVRAWSGSAGPGWRPWILAGVVLGAHALNRPNVLAWAAAAVGLTVILAWAHRRSDKALAAGPALPSSVAATVRPVLGVACGILLALSPVAARNYTVAGQLAPVSSHGGLNFFIGNNAEADGTYKTVRGVTPSMAGQDRDMRRVASEGAGRELTDTEASSWFYAQAFQWIRSNPGDAMRLFFRKSAFAFNAADIPLNQSYAFFRSDESLLLKALPVGAWLLLPLGLLGIVLARAALPDVARIRHAWWAASAFIPVYALAIVIFFVTGRYRLPLLVALVVPASAALDVLWSRARAAGWRGVAVPVAGLAVLGVLTNWNLDIDEGLAGWRAEMVQYHVGRGQYPEADALLARTEPIYPNPGLLLHRVARTYMERGQPDRAVALLERALAKSPGRPEVELALGQALVGAGRTSEAVAHLQAALAAGHRPDQAAFDLARALASLGNTEAATKVLRDVSNAGTLDPRAQVSIGRLALDLGDPGLAYEHLARAVTRLPGNATAHEGLGLALGMLGRREEAIGALQTASRLDPGNAATRFNLAVTYANAGRSDEAREVAEALVRERPDYTRAREFLAVLNRSRPRLP